MRQGPLDAEHRALNAKMGAFAGWQMPISYAGTLAEHAAVRENVGIFDVSHLGKVWVRDARVLDAQLTNRMDTLSPGRARYSLICNADGGILDDLIVYATDDAYLVVPNAANVGAVAERLGGPPADLCTIAVQGPRALDVIGSWFPAAKELGYMRVATDADLIVARSGYTGELGFEVFAPFERAPAIWAELLAAVLEHGGRPCGLGARDTLRLEMGYPLHGSDIDAGTTPLEAGLGWAVATEGRTFVGREALVGGSPARTLVGIRMLDKRIPRHGCVVLRDGARIGEVTSGTSSPTLRVGIGLAYVAAGCVAVGDGVAVDVRGKIGRGVVVDPPFVDRSPK